MLLSNLKCRKNPNETGFALRINSFSPFLNPFQIQRLLYSRTRLKNVIEQPHEKRFILITVPSNQQAGGCRVDLVKLISPHHQIAPIFLAG